MMLLVGPYQLFTFHNPLLGVLPFWIFHLYPFLSEDFGESDIRRRTRGET